jgi:hypothetical protein
MKNRSLSAISRIAAFAMAGWLLSPDQAAANPDDGYELLTRGPVHEAFAATVTYDAEPGIIIETAPPGAIEELPPEQQPEGENVVWIPGYWAWDEEQGTFLWVSGIWRNLPPGREWVPGYWNPIEDDRYQWISGYWADNEASEVSYLPEPPRSIESGPSIAAPSADHVWLPGTWTYQRNDYAWRSGYWAAPRENWVYVPATYVWTPRGYIFVNGYWDYAIPRRGVVFAPVHYHRPVYASAGYRYSPRLVISLSLFTDHLFLRPSYRHYYFGDYYAPAYRTRGYYSCFNYHHSRRGYDPIYVYDRWSHRHDRQWERNYRNRYERLRERESARPPHTWAAMQNRKEYREPARVLAAPIEQYVRNRDAGDGQKFRKLDKAGRERLVAKTREVRNFANDRRNSEGRAGKTAKARDKALKVERPRSPIASREQLKALETDRVRRDTRTARRTAPQTADRPERERRAREADRPNRVPERTGQRTTRPEPTRSGTKPERTAPNRRDSETPKALPQRQKVTPQRAQPSQRQKVTPQRAQPSQRQKATPQRAQPSQRQKAAPQRARRSQRQKAAPQRARSESRGGSKTERERGKNRKK